MIQITRPFIDVSERLTTLNRKLTSLFASANVIIIININTIKVAFQEAHKLQKCFSPGVIKIECDKAVVENARIDACTREAHRHDEFKV